MNAKETILNNWDLKQPASFQLILPGHDIGDMASIVSEKLGKTQKTKRILPDKQIYRYKIE